MKAIPLEKYVPLDIKSVQPLSISRPRSEGWPKKKPAYASAAPLLFVSSILCYVCAGLVSIALPPRASRSAGGFSIHEDATCLRVSRHAVRTVDSNRARLSFRLPYLPVFAASRTTSPWT